MPSTHDFLSEAQSTLVPEDMRDIRKVAARAISSCHVSLLGWPVLLAVTKLPPSRKAPLKKGGSHYQDDEAAKQVYDICLEICQDMGCGRSEATGQTGQLVEDMRAATATIGGPLKAHGWLRQCQLFGVSQKTTQKARQSMQLGFAQAGEARHYKAQKWQDTTLWNLRYHLLSKYQISLALTKMAWWQRQPRSCRAELPLICRKHRKRKRQYIC